jgi:outer membrane protein OmpA-like peptidoglycan-associated protein
VAWSPTRIEVLLPDLPAGPAPVRVIAGGRRIAAPAITVRAPPQQPPLANLVALPASRSGFVFDASLSVDPDGLGPSRTGKSEQGLARGIRTVLWNFGDGTTSTSPVATKTYARPGSYRVKLKVTDAAGSASTTSQVVQAVSPGASTSRPRARVNIRLPSQIVFDFGSFRLRTDSRTLLRRVGKVVRRASGPRRVAGYTDSIGPARFNLGLSRRRANVVRSFLVYRAPVSPRRIGSVGYGEGRPLASNRTEIGRQRNRRVIVTVRLPRVGLSRI